MNTSQHPPGPEWAHGVSPHRRAKKNAGRLLVAALAGLLAMLGLQLVVVSPASAASPALNISSNGSPALIDESPVHFTANNTGNAAVVDWTATPPGGGTPVTDTCTVTAQGSSCSVDLALPTPGAWSVVAHTGSPFGQTASMTQNMLTSAAASTTTVDQVALPVTPGQSVNLTAHVSVAGGYTPVGAVQFQDDSEDIGSAVVSGSGVAVLVQSFDVGDHPITALYTPAASGIIASTSAMDFAVGTPGAATNLQASIGLTAQQIKLTWTAPTFEGSTRISGYKVVATPVDPKVLPPDPVETTSTATAYTFDRLTPGKAYTFSVSAKNSYGYGPAVTSGSITPVGVPAAPTGVSAQVGSQSADISWTPPSGDDTGGQPLTGFKVYQSTDDVHYTLVGTAAAAATSLHVTGLTDGTPYTFKATALNASGESPKSEPSGSVTSSSVPGPPVNPTGTPGDKQVTLQFVPSAPNGKAVDRYQVVNVANGKVVQTCTVAETPSCTVIDGKVTITVTASDDAAAPTALVNGTAYTFKAQAHNANGWGLLSAPVTVTPAAAPDAPTNATAVALNGGAQVSWTAPANNGAAIDYYNVYTNGTGTPTKVNAPATSVTINGLTNGTSYTFTVKAHNAVDFSAAATTTSVTPSAPPSAPTNVVASVDPDVAGQAHLTWTAPTNTGGTGLTKYTMIASPGNIRQAVTGTWKAANADFTPLATSADFLGLTNGVSYTFTVTATNASQTSAASLSSNAVTPVGPPGAPQNLAAVPGDASLAISWQPPASDGGAPPVTQYNLSVTGGVAPITQTLAATFRNTTVSGLANGTNYTVTLTASNSKGEGTAATVKDAKPGKVPGAPTTLTTSDVGNQTVTLAWTAPTDTGGLPITKYVIVPSSGPTVDVTSTATGVPTNKVLTGLTNGTAYTFQVQAVTAFGTGPVSVASSPAVTPFTVPGAPTGVAAVRGDQQATISWVAPASNGGKAITGYRVQVAGVKVIGRRQTRRR